MVEPNPTPVEYPDVMLHCEPTAADAVCKDAPCLVGDWLAVSLVASQCIEIKCGPVLDLLQIPALSAFRFAVPGSRARFPAQFPAG